MLEADGADDEGVGDGHDDDGDVVRGGVQDPVAPRGSHACAMRSINMGHRLREILRGGSMVALMTLSLLQGLPGW